MKNVTISIFIMLTSAFINSTLGQSALTNITPLTQGGEFSTPIWSPNGEKILFTDHDNEVLYVLDVNNPEKIEKIKSAQGIGYLANWSANSNSIVFREKPEGGTFSDVQVKRISLKTKKEEVLKGVHPTNTKISLNAKSSETLIVYINQKTLKLEAKKGINGTPWIITKEDGEFYHPIVAPNQKSVAVHEGANIYVYAIYGKQKRKDLGIGLASSWLPDNSGVITFEDKSEDGHTISESELFYISTNSSKKTQLTYTNETAEMWGDVSPNGKKIAFSDEKTGKIFVADLNLKN